MLDEARIVHCEQINSFLVPIVSFLLKLSNFVLYAGLSHLAHRARRSNELAHTEL
jgi:hypothetical protein